MLVPSSGGLILYQAYGNLYAMTGRKAHLLEDKQISSVRVFDEVFSTCMAFGENTRDLGSFGEETDEITDLHQILEEVLLAERGDGVTSIKRRRRDLFSDGVWNLETALGRGRLKEDIESSIPTTSASVSKGEGEQLYGMSIPDDMMNDAIKNSDSYLAYLALSTNTEIPVKNGKGKCKGPMGKKKADTHAPKGKKSATNKNSSITSEDNILLDPDEAFKLGKSISLTEAKEQDEQRRVHETHERLVTEKTASDEDFDETNGEEEGRLIQKRPSGVVIGRDTPKVSNDETPDQSQKQKGFETLSITTQFMSEMKTTTKASKQDFRIIQRPKGLGEGFGVNPETLSRDDDRTDFDREKAESEKADNEIANEEQTNAKHDDEVKDNEEVADEETTDEEIDDDEKDNKEITDTDKADEEMVDAEKVDAEKTEEEKVDEEQTGDELIKMIKLKISCFQQEIPLVQQTSLLDVLISVIPKQTTSTPTTPPTTEAQAILVAKTDPSPTVLYQIPKFVHKVVSEFVEPRLERTVRDVLKKNPKNLVQSSFTQADSLSKLKLKKILMDKMQKSGSFLDHDKHLDLYNALMNSIGLDEAIEKGELDPAKVLVTPQNRLLSVLIMKRPLGNLEYDFNSLSVPRDLRIFLSKPIRRIGKDEYNVLI
ncbi:hypothetical protein Tco_0524071 [Tanacetum coccineum]